MRSEDLRNIERLEGYYQKKQREYFQKIADAPTYTEATKIADEYLTWAGHDNLKANDPKTKKMHGIAMTLLILEKERS